MTIRHRILRAILWTTFLAVGVATPVLGATAHVGTAALRGNLPILTWKDLRDDRVVKQNLDYSCGAASVATILSEYYGIPEATEKRVLEIINKEISASFHDLSQAVKDYGMKGLGLALDFAQLKRLKIPAVAYLRYRGDDHYFSVIRGVSRDGYVHLGDPSWGNRIFSKRQFLAMWETREGKTLKGKILLLLPTEQTTVATDPVFLSRPFTMVCRKHYWGFTLFEYEYLGSLGSE